MPGACSGAGREPTLHARRGAAAEEEAQAQRPGEGTHPARAGSRAKRTAPARSARDQPRTRGEQGELRLAPAGSSGPTPHARGAVSLTWGFTQPSHSLLQASKIPAMRANASYPLRGVHPAPAPIEPDRSPAPPFQPLTPRPTPHPHPSQPHPPSPNPTPSNPPRRPADPNRIHPVPRPHLPRSRSDVVPHGPVRQAQPPGDLRHRVPLRGPAQHPHLAW